ncbi:MAG: hypothetical protein SFV54_10755, partial [Bryobacteraceae bacterium]|nr:hypothetical protein [Bryobacteraceae bacterium]
MPAKRTEAQREAARRNGAKSQGPVTPEGKAKCAANGHQRSAPVREAARRIDTLLEADNHAAYVELFNRYLHTFQPTNPVELEIVTELARCRFKIERGEALASSL